MIMNARPDPDTAPSAVAELALADLEAVDRAVAELRRGGAVVILGCGATGTVAALVRAAETIDLWPAPFFTEAGVGPRFAGHHRPARGRAGPNRTIGAGRTAWVSRPDRRADPGPDRSGRRGAGAAAGRGRGRSGRRIRCRTRRRATRKDCTASAGRCGSRRLRIIPSFGSAAMAGCRSARGPSPVTIRTPRAICDRSARRGYRWPIARTHASCPSARATAAPNIWPSSSARPIRQNRC